jgi:hypothetical protein
LNEHQESAPRSTSSIRDMQSFVGGLVLLGFVALGWIAGANLSWGALNSIGPGLLPRVVLILIAGVGVTLIVHAFLGDGPRVLLRDFSGILALAALTLVAVILGAVLGLAGLGDILGLPPFALVFCIIYALTLIALLVYNGNHPGWLDRTGLRGPLFLIGGLIAFALTVRSVGLLIAAPLLALISGAASEETRFRELIIFAIVMTALCIGVFKYALNLPMPALVIPGYIYI